MVIIHDIEFCSDRWVKQRKENLYDKGQRYSRRWRIRILSMALFAVAAGIGLWATHMWKDIYIWENVYIKEAHSPYILLMALCGCICVFCAISLFNSFEPFRVRMPGTKLDYDGDFKKDMYRVEFGGTGFCVIKNGVKGVYKYSDMKQVYKDKRGILVVDIDLYIPADVMDKKNRRWIYGRLS